MMRLRDLIKELTRYPSRLLGDRLEDDVSVTSIGDANLEAKTKNDVQRKPKVLELQQQKNPHRHFRSSEAWA